MWSSWTRGMLEGGGPPLKDQGDPRDSERGSGHGLGGSVNSHDSLPADSRITAI